MRLTPWATAIAVALAVAPVPAQPKKPPPPKIIKDPPPPPLVGLTAVGELRPARGFVDDAIAVDGTDLIALVHDGGAVAATRVKLADATVTGAIAIGAVTPEPHHVVPVGDRLLVIHGVSEPRAATLVDGTGKAVRSWKPAAATSVRLLGDKPAVVTATVGTKGKARLHAVAAFDLASGKKLPKRGTTLTVGADGRDAKLDFRPAYFLDDLTVAVGHRGGVWRKAENQRSPDTWAAYDLVTGAWLFDQAIADPLALARRLPIAAAHPGERVFARMADDLSAVEVWRDGAPVELTLDQPVELYDPLSVQYASRGDALWIALTVDPTNPAAVKRQKVDPRYLDLFEVQGDRAVRRARLLVGKPGARWGWAGDRLWVIEKGAGISRGGAALALYAL